MTRIVLLGDVGVPGLYHSGVEAMASTAAAEIAARVDNTEIIAISSSPEETLERHGWESVRPIGFAGDMNRPECESRLEAVETAARGEIDALPWDDTAWEVIQAVTSAQSVIIAGGGNFNASAPEYIYERAALARISRALGRPYVISGHSVGPHLTSRDSELVAEILTGAVVVGVREAASIAVALALGVPAEKLCQTFDDAVSSYVLKPTKTEPVAEPYVAATFASHGGLFGGDDYVKLMTEAVRGVRAVTGLPVVLVPLAASLDGTRDGDLAIHDTIEGAVEGVKSLALEPGAAPGVVAGAALVLSSRYHPAVWGLAAGVPSVGLVTDSYSSSKISGAFANHGVDEWALPAATVATGLFEDILGGLWSRRDAVAEHLAAQRNDALSHSASWWDIVSAALTGKDLAPMPTFPSPTSLPDSPYAEQVRRLRNWEYGIDMQVNEAALMHTAAEAAMRDVREESRKVVDRASELDAEVERLSVALEAALAGHEATQVLLARRITKNFQRRASRETGPAAPRSTPARSTDLSQVSAELEAARRELENLKATRTFRYTSGLRRVYGLLRRR